MNFFSVPTFIISFLILALGLTIYGRGKKNKTNIVFFRIGLSIATWLFFESIAYNCRDANNADIFMRICYLGISFIPVTTSHFILEFLRVGVSRFFIICLYFAGLTFGYFMLFYNYFIIGVSHCFWGFYPRAGIYHPAFLFFLFGNALTMIYLLIREYLKAYTSILRRNQIKYILIAFFFLATSTVDFIPVYGVNLYPFGYIPVTLFLIIIAYGTIKYRVLDITIAITRTGIFVVVYSFVLGIPFALAFGWQERLKLLLGNNWWLAPLISSTVLATAGPFIYLFIQKRAEDRLLAEQKRYQNTLRQASSGMGRIKNLKKLLGLIVRIVNRTVNLDHTCVYLYNQIEKKYYLEACRDHEKFTAQPMIDPKSPLVDYLLEIKEPVVYEEVRQRSQDYKDERLSAVELEMRNLDAALAVPSMIEDRLLGILVLGKKRSGKLFSGDDLTVFSVLANQLALAVENILASMKAEMKQNELFQAEKLAHVGSLASSVAHEIRNPLTSLKTFVEYLPKKYQDPEFRKNFDSIVPSEIGRIEKIINQLMDLSKPRETVLRPVNLTHLISSSLLLISNHLAIKRINVKKNFSADDTIIKADEEQLRQVFLNLFLNAIAAMDDGGVLTIGISHSCKSAVNDKKADLNADTRRSNADIRGSLSESNLRPSAFDMRESAFKAILITIQDNGCGISPENLKKIFTPFFTTKKDGFGLGLIISEEIIKHHKGTISVESRVGEGTKFTIVLPAALGMKSDY